MQIAAIILILILSLLLILVVLVQNPKGGLSSQFTGGGASFKVTGMDVAEFGYSAGAGLSYTPSHAEDLTMSINYDANMREQYVGHSANFTLRMSF